MMRLTFLLAACTGFTGVASNVAHTEANAAEILRRDASTAGAICRVTASYSYFEMRLGLGPQGPVASPPTFSAWYATEIAAKNPDLAWSAYCDDLDRTGALYRLSVLSLRHYALAIASLADAKEFDASGLGSVGDGVGSAASALHASDAAVSTIKGAANAATTLAGFVVREIRNMALEKFVDEGAPHAAKIFEGLAAYLDALEAERKLALHHREIVLKIADKMHDSTADLAITFDMAAREDRALAEIGNRIAADAALIKRARAAHDALVSATHGANAQTATDAAAALAKEIQNINDERGTDGNL